MYTSWLGWYTYSLVGDCALSRCAVLGKGLGAPSPLTMPLTWATSLGTDSTTSTFQKGGEVAELKIGRRGVVGRTLPGRNPSRTDLMRADEKSSNQYL